MKTIINLFFDTYRPRKCRYDLTYYMREKDDECMIRITQKGKEVLKVTEEDRNLCFEKATKDLVRHFPIDQVGKERVG